MRKIKLRAFDKVNKWMLLSTDEFWINGDGEASVKPRTTYDTPHVEITSTDDLVIMESSGMVDKEGKEIFEGDILSNGIACFVVTFRNGSFALGNVRLFSALTREPNFWKLVGNIHENPRLLVNH